MVLISCNLQFFVDRVFIVAPCVKICRSFSVIAISCKLHILIPFLQNCLLDGEEDGLCQWSFLQTIFLLFELKVFQNLPGSLTSPSPHWTCLWYCRLDTSGWPGFGKISNIKTDLDEDKLKKRCIFAQVPTLPAWSAVFWTQSLKMMLFVSLSVWKRCSHENNVQKGIQNCKFIWPVKCSSTTRRDQLAWPWTWSQRWGVQADLEQRTFRYRWKICSDKYLLAPQVL